MAADESQLTLAEFRELARTDPEAAAEAHRAGRTRSMQRACPTCGQERPAGQET